MVRAGLPRARSVPARAPEAVPGLQERGGGEAEGEERAHDNARGGSLGADILNASTARIETAPAAGTLLEGSLEVFELGKDVDAVYDEAFASNADILGRAQRE